MASRLPRETAESTTEIFDDLKQKLSQGLADLQKKAQETFTKENAQVCGLHSIITSFCVIIFALIFIRIHCSITHD